MSTYTLSYLGITVASILLGGATIGWMMKQYKRKSK